MVDIFKLFLSFQNYLMIQLPMFDIDLKYWMKLVISFTLGLKNR